MIKSFSSQKVGMSSLLSYDSFVDHKQHIRISDSRQTMGDDDGSPAFRRLLFIYL